MTHDAIITLGHGAGGQMTGDLLDNLILPILHKNGKPQELEDAVRIDVPKGDLYFTTDSYVVDPFIFPGGNIGHLCVHGTVNDLAMSGAKPVAISLGFILEEGLLIDDLKTVLRSICDAAREANVRIACGDTKVVPRGKGDKIFINTSGIGVTRKEVNIKSSGAKARDKILINGTIGDHGVAVMSAREGLSFDSSIKSDTAALNGIVELLLDANITIHAMRDPTRGGLATTMIEIAESSDVEIRLDERAIPVSREVNGACEILGLDPMQIANEGKMVAFVPPCDAERALSIMRSHPLGGDSAIIGEVHEGYAGRVTVTSFIGGARIMSKLPGELLPRIC